VAKIQGSPCAPCVTQARGPRSRRGEGQTTIGDLNLETTMLRNYYAGGKSSDREAAPAAPPLLPKKE